MASSLCVADALEIASGRASLNYAEGNRRVRAPMLDDTVAPAVWSMTGGIPIAGKAREVST
jgi:hypothetical protein